MLFRRSVHEIMRQIYQVLWRINCWTFQVSFVICTDFLVGYTWASASFFIVLLKCAAGIVCCWLSAFLPNFIRYFGYFNANENFSFSNIMEFTCFLQICPKFRLFWPFFIVSLDVILLLSRRMLLDVACPQCK